jgi:hypothetical protein
MILKTLLVTLGAACLFYPHVSSGQISEPSQSSHWKSVLADRFSEYGHRNWIVISDSAYPAQTRPGIETVVTHEDQLTVVKCVLEQFEKAKHIRPIVYLDQELNYVTESDAAGIEAYRTALTKLIGTRKTMPLPHEQTLNKLDKAGASFKVLVLKTDQALPYTSVFFELGCGYWSPEAEARLREALKADGK